MKRLMLILILFWVGAQLALAQEVVETPTSGSTTSLFAFIAVVMSLVSVIHGLLLYKSVPAASLKEFATALREYAATTPNTVDDKVAGLVDLFTGGTKTIELDHPAINTGAQPIPTQPPQEIGVPVNANHALDAVSNNGLRFYPLQLSGRSIAVPHQFQARWVALPADPKNQPGVLSPPPDTFYKAERGGFESAIAYKAGHFGYEVFLTNGIVRSEQRYALVVEYEAQFQPEKGADKNPTLYLEATLIDGDSEILRLEAQAVVNGQGSAQWVVSTPDHYQSLAVLFQLWIPFAVIADQSTFLWKQIKVVPVMADYGEDMHRRF